MKQKTGIADRLFHWPHMVGCPYQESAHIRYLYPIHTLKFQHFIAQHRHVTASIRSRVMFVCSHDKQTQTDVLDYYDNLVSELSRRGSIKSRPHASATVQQLCLLQTCSYALRIMKLLTSCTTEDACNTERQHTNVLTNCRRPITTLHHPAGIHLHWTATVPGAPLKSYPARSRESSRYIEKIGVGK